LKAHNYGEGDMPRCQEATENHDRKHQQHRTMFAATVGRSYFTETSEPKEK